MSRADVFPLVTRPRALGVAAGASPSSRRGIGDESATLRPYRSGDSVRTIDWKATARRSAARDADEFLVRDAFADESPRVVCVLDRRPQMALSPLELPWLHKPAATRAAVDLVARSVRAARGATGYLDGAEEERAHWLPPQRRGPERVIAAAATRPYSGDDDSLARTLAQLLRHGSQLPTGSFVFVLSDFLVPVPDTTWRAAGAMGWDVVPVVIQDPRWEQSFPDVRGATIAVCDGRGRPRLVWLRRREARALRTANERRLVRLLDGFAGLGLDPVLLGSSEPDDVLGAFLGWADTRTGHGRRRRG